MNSMTHRAAGGAATVVPTRFGLYLVAPELA
jgi:hypothetical protein